MGREGAAKRFGAADKAVVVKALAGGAKVKEAAALAGFSLKTLVYHRERDPLFASAWAAAVEESGRPMLVAPRGGRRWQAQRARRNRFSSERKQAFLTHLAVTADATASAEAAGVCVWTAYEHRRNDPAFADGWEEALGHAYARLETDAVAQRIAAMEALRARLGEEAAPYDADAAAEFERVLKLLREYKRWRSGTQGGRPLGKWSFEDAFRSLEKRLAVFGLRIERGEEAPDDDAD